MIFYPKSTVSEFLRSLIKYSYLGWLVYFLVFNLYSIFWRQVNAQLGYDYVNTLTWFLKEWGVWLLVTPLILLLLEKTTIRFSVLSTVSVFGLVFLLFTMMVRIQLNSGEYPLGWFSTTVLIFPKYVCAYLAITGLWCLLKRQKFNKSKPSKHLNDYDGGGITAEHHGLRKTLKRSQIITIKSSGNYMEIECEDTTYLKRGTLKKLLGELPSSTFIRVHRSYVINLRKIIKLTNNSNGGSTVTMSNQKNIPVSRKYKSNLKNLSTLSN